jgi:hypothetical protein
MIPSAPVSLTPQQQQQLDRGLWLVEGRARTYLKSRLNADGTLWLKGTRRRFKVSDLGRCLFFTEAEARTAALAYYREHQAYFAEHERETHAPEGTRST